MLPRWLLNKAWEIQTTVACSGWTTFIRQYIVVPYDSPVWSAISGGTPKELLKMFEKGLVSPFSMSPRGETLLHVSDVPMKRTMWWPGRLSANKFALYCRWDLIEHLVRIGLKLDAWNIRYDRCSQYYRWPAEGLSRRPRCIDLCYPTAPTTSSPALRLLGNSAPGLSSWWSPSR